MKKLMVFAISLSLLYFSAAGVKIVSAQDQKGMAPSVSSTPAPPDGEDGLASGKISKSSMDGKPESVQYVITSDKNEKTVIMGSKDILDKILSLPDFGAASFKLRGKIIKADGKTGIIANSFEVVFPGMPEGPQLKSMPAASGPPAGETEVTGPVTFSTTPVELPKK